MLNCLRLVELGGGEDEVLEKAAVAVDKVKHSSICSTRTSS